ncbi:MAG TPA: TolC family protein [Gemmatimonadales bacterium]|nr:TolC family protein [Gemmatimonadales bacterium]
MRSARAVSSVSAPGANEQQQPANGLAERRRHFCWRVVALALCGWTGLSAQTVSDTFRLADAIRLALANNPMLHAARSEATAASDRIGPAGALPDPQVQFNTMNRAAPSYGYAGNVMTQDQQQLMFTFPWPGKLGGAKRAAEHTAAAMSADADDQQRMLVSDVRMAYFDIAYTDRALDVIQETRALMRQFLEVSTTMYAVGGAVQQDVLRAQVELGRMAEDQTRMGQDRVAMAARLNSLMGRDPSVPIGTLELPEPQGELPDVDSLVARGLVARPALRAASERVEASEGSLLSARRQIFPDVMLGLAFNQSYALGSTANFMAWITLPIFAGGKQLAMKREAVAMLDASQADLLSVRNETVARIIETRARAEEDRNLVRLYRSGIVPQAQAAVTTSLASYRVGQLSFMQLIDNQLTVKNYQTEAYRLLADYQQALGELSALVGGPVTEVSP